MSVSLRHRALLAATTTLTLAGALAPAGAEAAAGDLPTQPNACWSSDNGTPVIDSVTLTPSVIDTSAGPVTVHVAIAAHDTGGPGPASGLADVSTYIRITSSRIAFRPTLTDAGDGAWQGTFVVPEGISGPAYASVTADDERYDPSYDRVRQGPTRTSPALSGTVTRTFADVATITSDTSDTTDPELSGLSVSPAQVDSRRHAAYATVEAHVTDDLSGLESVFIGGNAHNFDLHHVSGDLYRGQVPAPRGKSSGTRELSFYAEDVAGNRMSVGPAELEARGFASSFGYKSGSPDTKKPEIVRIAHRTHQVDVRRHGAWFKIRLVASDNRGVTHVTTWLDGLSDGVPAKPLETELHRVSGTARHGTWAGRIRVTPCTLERYTTQHNKPYIRVKATDDFRTASKSIGRLQVRSQDRTRPTVHDADGSGYSFTFSEAVHGVSDDNVAIVYYGPHYDELTVSATWVCRNGAGKHTSCLHGSVRSATAHLDDDSHYIEWVEWSPDHHLGVLDRAGNPVVNTIFYG